MDEMETIHVKKMCMDPVPIDEEKIYLTADSGCTKSVTSRKDLLFNVHEIDPIKIVDASGKTTIATECGELMVLDRENQWFYIKEVI